MADKKTSGEKLLYCSFCGKSQHEVRKLIAGPSVFICDECIELCNDIIRDEITADTGGAKGVKGERTATYQITYTNGKATAKKLISAEVTTEPTDGETSGSTTPTLPAVPGTPAERLSVALDEAKTAMDASRQAQVDGDWDAYGEAQEALNAALEQAIAAQNELEAAG